MRKTSPNLTNSRKEVGDNVGMEEIDRYSSVHRSKEVCPKRSQIVVHVEDG